MLVSGYRILGWKNFYFSNNNSNNNFSSRAFQGKDQIDANISNLVPLETTCYLIRIEG